MSKISVILGDIEVDAEKAITWIEGKTKATPAVLAALAVLAAGVEKGLADIAADAQNPLSIPLGPTTSDFKAVWPEVKSFLLTLGIKF